MPKSGGALARSARHCSQAIRLRISGGVRHNGDMASDLIIFDCNGVLIDSEFIACWSSAACLTEIGIPITVDEIAERYVGIGTTAMFADLEARSGMSLPLGFAEKVRLHLMNCFDLLDRLPPRASTFAACVEVSVPRGVMHNRGNRYRPAYCQTMGPLRPPGGPCRGDANGRSPRYFKDYLSRRWDAGCTNGGQLLDEIKRLGYTGCYSHLQRFLAGWRRAESRNADPLGAASGREPGD
jgi:hypothetical protein